MKYWEIHPGFKCRSSSKFLLRPWFSFIQAVFVSPIYWLDWRNESSTKTSLGSTELRGYVIGSPNESSICPGQRLQRRRHSTRLRSSPVSAGILRILPSPFAGPWESRWILFDPTRLAPQSSFVRIGQGRDAADTSFATIFGGAKMNKMELAMQPGTGQRNSPEYTTAPISNYPSCSPA
jgi:hypothetical protein